MASFFSNPTAVTAMKVYLALAVYSAAVQNLPNPSIYGGVWYKAVYGFLSVLGADFKSFAATLPSSESRVEPSLTRSTQSGTAAGE